MKKIHNEAFLSYLQDNVDSCSVGKANFGNDSFKKTDCSFRFKQLSLTFCELENTFLSIEDILQINRIWWGIDVTYQRFTDVKMA